MTEKHYKYELKIKKKFPFLYINKREEYIVERIERQYKMIINIYPIVLTYYGLGKLMTFIAEKLGD